MNRFLACALMAGTLFTAGCSSFERDAFNTLSASKAVLDTAQKDYQARIIPKTQCAYSLINNGKAAQAVAVTGLQDYHNVAAAKGNVSAAQATVIGELASLAPIVIQVQTLISNPATSCTNSPEVK